MGLSMVSYRVAEKLSNCHCEERFLRRGNLEVIDILRTEIASLRSQRRLKDFFSILLEVRIYMFYVLLSGIVNIHFFIQMVIVS